MHNLLIRISCVCALALIPISAAPGQVTFRVVKYMDQLDQPAGVLEGSPSVLYSTAGSYNTSIISLTTQGKEKVLTTFPSGYNVQSAIVSGANGRFYSSVQKGTDPNAVFSVTPTGGAITYPNQFVLPLFSQNLPDGSLLGTGVNPSVVLSVVKTALDGTVTTIYQFPSTDYPTNVILANDGNYYGVFYNTNAQNAYVFRVTQSGTMTQLFEFPYHTITAGYSYAPLLQATDGNLYGAIYSFGANGSGLIYKITLSGQYTELYSFPKGKYYPTALIEGSDGNLYGATQGLPGSSQLFRVTKSGQYTTLYTLTNPTTEGACTCRLTQGSDGIIYGSAQGGGPVGAGLYFALDAGLAKPAPNASTFTPQSGAAGTKVLLWGKNLLSAAVTFNGVAAAQVTNSGPNYVWATVPAGASTGPVTVTTPGGASTTKGSFTVQ